MSKSFNRRIIYHVAYNIMLVALYLVCSIVLLFPYQNRVFTIIGFGVTSYFKKELLHVMSVFPTAYVHQIKIYILAVFLYIELIMFLLYYIIVLYIHFIYYITFRINSKYLSNQEYRTTITITITMIQILHHPLLLYLYVVAFYVKTMLPYVFTSLTHLYHHIVYSITDVYYFHMLLVSWHQNVIR